MRKINSILFVSLLFFCICLLGCDGDVVNAGSSTLSDSDEICVKSDTFSVVSTLDSCAAISLTPDSFLLGECDTHFGTIKADILTQLACPEGFEYPGGATAQVDSVCLYLYYRNWYGDGNAPLGIAVYELDRQTLDINTLYPNNMVLADYCSLADSTSIAAQSTIIIPSNMKDSSYLSESNGYVTCVAIKLSDAFAKRFFQTKTFTSQDAFNEQFKGLYVCADFGGSTVLYVMDMSMSVYYHFTMHRPGVNDTVISDVKSFYANEEVRLVNRFIYPNREATLQHYAKVLDTNYIVSPANIYTHLSVRMDSIYNRIDEQLVEADKYRVYVNKAELVIDVLYDESETGRPRDTWDIPAANMLLLRADKQETFFTKNELPSDTVAILASLSAETDSLANVSYSYTYDLSGMLTQQLRSADRAESLEFVLVPVSVNSNAATGGISAVKQLQTISATRIRSANNVVNPMDIEMVYSGFHLTR